MRYFILSLILFVSIYPILAEEDEDFYFDAIVFKSDKPEAARVDVFSAVPYQRLNFAKVANTEVYSAAFELIITCTNTDDNSVKTLKYNRKIAANSYGETQGQKAEFSYFSESILLPQGTYKFRAVLHDVLSNREFEKNRQINVINFDNFPIVMSSLMLVSSIDEENNNYTITPFITDNIGNLTEGYFCFFEVYNDGGERETEVVVEIIDNTTTQSVYTNKLPKIIKSGTTRLFVKIPTGIIYGSKQNSIKIFLVNKNNNLTNSSEEQILAAASRSIKCNSFLNNRILANLQLAIRQLRYVASQTEIDRINTGANDTEKLSLFEEFWKNLDPTPITIRNEAMEEYYGRIDYANKNFKAYVEGWLSDKGQVYIIFGTPDNIEHNNHSMADNRTYERWTYYNNHEFVFLDVSGFGDFRLYSPKVITDKYQYR